MVKHLTALALTLAFTLSSSLSGQEKLFEANDYMNRDLYPKSISNLSWRGNQDVFTFMENNALIQKAAANPEQADTILKLDQLNGAGEKCLAEPLKRFPSITWMDNNRFNFTKDNAIFTFQFSDTTLKKINSYPDDAENIIVDEKTLSVAYTIDNNLFMAINGETMQISEAQNPDIVYGQVPSRNEFGIDQGSYWSPDGKLLAFYKTDQTEVTDYPMVDIYHRIAQTDPIKYPMAGMKSQKVSLGIFNPDFNEITWIRTTGPENQYLTGVSWGPESKFIYIGLLNRDQNHLVYNKYDVQTGKFIKTLFEEINDRYVEPMHGLYFLESNPQQFIWQSQRDGFNHLYLYDVDGNLIKQITEGKWVVTDFLGLDPDGKTVYYECTKDSPLERQLYKTDIKKLKTSRITNGEGTHNIRAAGSMEYFIDIFSSTDIARAYYLLDEKGEIISTLLEDQDPWEEYKTGELDIFTIKADDGETDLYCRIIKPIDFDPTKKYPAIVYVYGGPHAQLVTNSWAGGANFWLNYWAQQGYVVFTLDNRGSANRGFEFESIIHRNVGDYEMADQLSGVDYLKSLDFVDPEKVGVDGWSYGGFMSISLLLRNPGVFKVAFAGGPVIDWKWYEVMYGERYMDTPMQNPEGYDKACLLNYVGNLDGKLLIINGTNDPTVVWQNSLTFLDECIKQGKQVDYFVYPGAGHNMRGKSRVHLFEKITGYFNDYLK